MSEKNRKIILGIFLTVALIWGYINSPWNRQTTTEIPQPAATALAGANMPATSSPAIEHISRSLLTAGEMALMREKNWGPDPFFRADRRPNQKRSINAKGIDNKGFKLSAILYNETAPSAYLNNQVVTVGDNIDGATVIKIEKRSLTLKQGSEVFTIKVSRG